MIGSPLHWAYFKLVVTAALWGGTFIAGRVVAQVMGPFTAAFCRFAIASVALLLLIYRIEGGLPCLSVRQAWQVVLLGMTGIFAYNVFFFSGLQTVTAGRAALIIALNPVAIALGSALVYRDPLSGGKRLGIGLSLTGAAVVISGGNPTDLLRGGLSPGDGFLLGCVFSWMSYTLLGKAVMGQLSALAATTYGCLAGTVLLLVPALAEGLIQTLPTAGIAAWAGLGFLGLLGSAVGFSWYYEGLKAIGPARAGVFINLVPAFAILLAALLLQEPVPLTLLGGGSLIVAGVILTNRT
ncbi:EamA family transporter [filamentous cyanobacterium CCP5]|nr:EamA family transporter [filamentous cyanobacterium CCP5]